MSNSKHSWDGRQVTGVISGFSEYTLLDRAASHETAVITPEDVLKKLESIKRFLNVPELEHALNTLREHINDTNNPHNTALNQLYDQVIDSLYTEYQKQGGKISKEEYGDSLFKVLHVASMDELRNGDDETAVISVAGLRNLIHEHEIDPDAHKELLNNLFPGKPVTADPIFAIDSEAGIPEELIFKDDYTDLSTLRVPYTYVGIDRNIHLAESTDVLPLDYQYGVPLIPCFGFRKNYLSRSNGFGSLLWTNALVEAGISDLMGNTEAAEVRSIVTDTEVEHCAVIPNVELTANEYRTFSIYAKANTARYLKISYDDSTSNLPVSAIFDLVEGTSVILNPMTRYSHECCLIKNSWYRCSLSMFSNVNQQSDITLTFFKVKNLTSQDYAFKDTEITSLCYLWGMQLENGNNMSPYIPTNGTVACRDPLYIKKELNLVNNTAMTVSCITRNTPAWIGKDTRPVHVTRTTVDYASEVLMRPTGYIDFIKWGTVSGNNTSFKTLMDMYPLGPFTDKYCMTTSSISENGITNAYNKSTTTALKPPIYDIGNVVYFGYNGGDYYEGYLKSMVIYNTGVDVDQAIFLNGETIYDNE